MVDMIKIRYYSEIAQIEHLYRKNKVTQSVRDQRVAFLRSKIKEREGVGRFTLGEQIEPNNE